MPPVNCTSVLPAETRPKLLDGVVRAQNAHRAFWNKPMLLGMEFADVLSFGFEGIQPNKQSSIRKAILAELPVGMSAFHTTVVFEVEPVFTIVWRVISQASLER
jgi:hypothetical protein